MSYLRTHKISVSAFVMVAVLLALALFIAPTNAAQGGNGNGNGFRALNGQDAQVFNLPKDVTNTGHQKLDKYGVEADRFQQFVGKAAVLGGQMTVYNDIDSGETMAVIGAHYEGLMPTNHIALNEQQARQTAMQAIGQGGKWDAQLMINPSNGRYFYIVETQRADSRWFHWVDAETGEVTNAYDGVAHGDGVGVLGDTKDLTGLTTQSGSTYQLVSADGRFTTYDANNRSRLPGTLGTDSDDHWTDGAMVDAHFYAYITDNYYQSTHGFNWTDHYSQGMISSAHVQRDYNNAYWNGTQMAYGDGDGTTFIAFSADLDIVGHELSHGVTEATSNLIYQNESGALNESFSDMMGTAIEYDYYGANYDGLWTLGEDAGPDGSQYADGLRNLADPTVFGDPSHWADRYTGTGDNGGVHINSSISNHWFYLLVEGGQNAAANRASGTNVQPIGMVATEEIVFLAYTALPASADFCDARAATLAVAGNNSANVADAWDEVGVDDALCGGGGSGGGGGTGSGPVISNVSAVKVSNRGTFVISWDTDVASDSEVTFTCCGSYSDTVMTTSHSMSFNGSKGATYEYFVTSTDASGSSTTEGPFVHQN